MNNDKFNIPDDPAFEKFMEGLRDQVLPNTQKIADALLDLNFANLELHILGDTIRGKGKEWHLAMLRAVINGGAVLISGPLHKDALFVSIEDLRLDPMKMEMGRIERFRFIESPLAQKEPEPVAKNGKKASPKTLKAKVPLAFYHKNRRF